MKFIQTLSINKDPFQNGFGWAAPEYHLMSWALSSLQLNKIYHKTELYANSHAAKLLIDTLDLPYSKVNITHDNLKLPDENLWALPKIFTYSLQDEPFLHIDGDVFLFNQLPDALLKNELIAQNIEEATNYYASTQKELMANFSYFPNCVKADFSSSIPIRGINAGILGGSNISFFKEYASAAFDYINRNVKHFRSIILDRFNIFFEQHLFYCLAKEKGISVGVLISDVINDNEYKYIGDIHEAPCCRNYLHLLGHLKKDEYTCIQMAGKLRELYPEYYYKIISLFKKKSVPVSQDFWRQENFDSIDDFLFFNKEARAVYCNDKYKLNKNPILRADENIPFELVFLNKIVTDYINKPNCPISKEELQNDFTTFAENLKKFLRDNLNISHYWLYGRDLESVNWYCKLFRNESEFRKKIVVKCKEINIIESKYDWAGLLNKYKRVGVRYYDDFELLPGWFFNLVVPESYKNGFSIFDLDEMEKIILDHLSNPLSINKFLKEMQCYAEEDVIQNHLEIFNDLIITLLKQLVVKKAIKPI